MSDRCGLTIAFRKTDADRVKRILGQSGDWEFADDYETWMEVEFSEIDCGGLEEREALTRMDISFYGAHTGGCEYGPCRFASNGLEHVEVEVDHNGRLIVVVGNDGEVGEHDLRAVRAFLKIERSAEAIVQAGDAGHKP